MKQIVCENCGSHDFTLNNGYKICQFCNTKYLITEDDIPKKESFISVGEDVKRLLVSYPFKTSIINKNLRRHTYQTLY